MSRNNGCDSSEGSNGWLALAGGIATAAAAVGGIYLLTSRDKKQGSQNSARNSATVRANGDTNRNSSSGTAHNSRKVPSLTNGHSQANPYSGVMDLLSTMLGSMSTNRGRDGRQSTSGARRGIPSSSIPDNPKITNLNAILSDIYLRYIALNDEDFEKHYSVVHNVFLKIHNKMKEIDPYYRKYSSTVRYAGSHPDRLRINKPDEFDIDIVIGLPLCINQNPLNPADSDILLEPKDPGFAQLKMGVQFQRLLVRDGCDWHINKTAYEWKDEKNYLQRSKFSNWFKSVVNRALDSFKPNRSDDPVFYVEGVPYTVERSESGPAMTIYVLNKVKNFKLDVDLVPALRFPLARWKELPTSYRKVPSECFAAGNDYWMLVPKPNKSGQNQHDTNRSWRMAMHEQERMLMYDTKNMRQAIRLIKKLRDAQNMTKIASYYIKTLFFWEAEKHLQDRSFWHNNPAFLFKVMLKNFHEALEAGKILYFWNSRNNLIGHVDKATLIGYASMVGKLRAVLEDPARYKEVAKFLLTRGEYEEYYRKILCKV